MKTSIQIWFISLLITISVSNSISSPLSGTYTVGSTGRYLTINSAINDALTQGISGPVIFAIFPGIYSEGINVLSSITGSSLNNTITFKSQTGISSDVFINGISINSSNIILNQLSLNNLIHIFYGKNISLIYNNLNSNYITVGLFSYNINIFDNYNISSLNLQGQDIIGLPIQNVQIINNNIGHLYLNYCFNFLVEKNIISNGISTNSSVSGIYSKNIITGIVNSNGSFYNNFIIGQVGSLPYNFVNNTVVGGSLSSPTYLNPKNCYNNIFINPTGGPTIHSEYPIQASDYNLYYNGGNNNLINFLGISYNNVQDFYNVTGLDQHSSDQPVSFVSPTDLHLASTSFGDPNLIGIPDTNVVDDIDGQIRSLTSPFKGADEIFDIPSPVELSAFNSTINLNNVNLYWTTTSEINNLGFVIERSINNQDWLNVGFVQGHGTITSINNYEFIDKGLNSGKYNYRLKQLDYNGNYEYFNLSEAVIIGFPDKFLLSQNYPNPFNPVTLINYELPSYNNVQLKVYDNSGKELITLVNSFKEAGRYNVTFDGSNFASGVYYYKLTAGNFTSVKKMFLIK